MKAKIFILIIILLAFIKPIAGNQGDQPPVLNYTYRQTKPAHRTQERS